MSTSTKSIIIFLIVVLILLGVWWMLAGKSQPTPAQSAPVTQNVTTTTSAGQAPSPATSVAGRDDSNTSLDQDLNSVDAQLKVVDTNSASVDQSLNDKPVAQTE
jgi:cytoskeletal protein RodZ